MKRATSVRRNAGTRKRIDETSEARLDELSGFEEVALDLNTPNTKRPGISRSLTYSSRDVAEQITNSIPRDHIGSSKALDRFHSYTKSEEQLPLEKSQIGRSSVLRHSRLSSSSLPALDTEDFSNSLTLNPRPRQSRTSRLLDNDKGNAVSDNSDSDSDSVPEIVILDNVPISPRSLEIKTSKSDNDWRQEADNLDEHSRRINTQTQANNLTYHESLLNNMDPGTRHLNAELDDHAVRQLSAARPNGSIIFANAATKSRSERKASAKAMAGELRPVIDRRIEAIPISREKEALLACTRPTYLPPKSRKEEKKHLKEYERLMFGSLEAEKKSQKRRSRALTQKAKHLTNSADIWDNDILPHFSTAVKDPRTKALWWGGLPNRVRGRIWSMCIGNTLAVSENTFKIALAKSRETEQILKSQDNDGNYESRLLTLDSFLLLEQSVTRTYPDLKIFQKGGPLYEPLVEVLMAYVYYRQDVMVSYVEGVNYIAGLLLMYLPPVQTFITLVNVLNRSLPLAIYTRDEPVLNRFVGIFLTRLSQRLPRLHKHLYLELQLAPLVYLEPMLVSLLSKQAPVDISSRIFDIYAFEGDAFLIRAIVGVFIVLEHALYGTSEEVLNILSGNDKEHTWEKNLKEEDFIKTCRAAF